MEKVNVQALKVREGKQQSMVPGKVYAVSEDMAKILIENNKAVEAKEGAKPGDTYELPEDPNADLLGGAGNAKGKSKKQKKKD